MADRHKRGWKSPANRQLKTITLDLRPETLAAWKEAAKIAGMSQRQAAEQMFCKFAREHGVEVEPPPMRKGWKPPSPDS